MASSLLDWSEAIRWGETYAWMRTVPHVNTIQIDRLHRLVRGLASQVHPIVQSQTQLGNDLPAPHIEVVSRGKLVEASVNSMRNLAEPHAQTLAQASQFPNLLRRRIWAHHLGAIAGMYAQKVLGQHELFIPPAHTSGRTWLVGPNITALAKQAGGQANALITGVLCAQLASRTLFDGVDWVRPYAMAVFDTYIRDIDRYDRAFLKALERFSAFFTDVAPVDHDDVANGTSLVFTPRQLRAIHAGQAFFSAIEGYVALSTRLVGHNLGIDTNLVREYLANYHEGHQIFLHFTRVFPGLRMKQYEAGSGEAFVQTLYATGGMALVNRIWASPQTLPRINELAHPQRWMARVAR